MTQDKLFHRGRVIHIFGDWSLLVAVAPPSLFRRYLRPHNSASVENLAHRQAFSDYQPAAIIFDPRREHALIVRERYPPAFCDGARKIERLLLHRAQRV